MPWLVAGDRVVASVEVAVTRRARRRGLLGRDGIEGALLLEPARSVHTVGMRFPIDVAFLARDGTVLDDGPGLSGGPSVATSQPVFSLTEVDSAPAACLKAFGNRSWCVFFGKRGKTAPHHTSPAAVYKSM